MRATTAAELAIQHRWLARAIARRYRSSTVDGEDLEQVAMEALTKAAQRFDPSQGSPFNADAGATIPGRLKQFLRDHSWDLRPSRPLQERHATVRRATEDLSASLGRSPTATEAAASLGVSKDSVLEALDAAAMYRLRRLEAPASPEGLPLESQVGATDGGFDHVEQRALVRDLLQRLDSAMRRWCASGTCTTWARQRSPSVSAFRNPWSPGSWALLTCVWVTQQA